LVGVQFISSVEVTVASVRLLDRKSRVIKVCDCETRKDCSAKSRIDCERVRCEISWTRARRKQESIDRRVHGRENQEDITEGVIFDEIVRKGDWEE